jgi:hypothetical protein
MTGDEGRSAPHQSWWEKENTRQGEPARKALRPSDEAASVLRPACNRRLHRRGGARQPLRLRHQHAAAARQPPTKAALRAGELPKGSGRGARPLLETLRTDDPRIPERSTRSPLRCLRLHCRLSPTPARRPSTSANLLSGSHKMTLPRSARLSPDCQQPQTAPSPRGGDMSREGGHVSIEPTSTQDFAEAPQKVRDR